MAKVTRGRWLTVRAASGRAAMPVCACANASACSELVQTPLGGRVVCEERDLLYEEAPAAYKNIEAVIADLVDAGLVSVIATFRPLLTYKTRKAKFSRLSPSIITICWEVEPRLPVAFSAAGRGHVAPIEPPPPSNRTRAGENHARIPVFGHTTLPQTDMTAMLPKTAMPRTNGMPNSIYEQLG